MNYLKRHKILLSILTLVIFTMVLVPQAMGNNKSYYFGDAINYRGQLIIGSVNMGYLELFQLQGETLVEKSRIYSTEARLYGNDNFYDLLLDKSEGRLYVYLVDGRSLQKYDISDLSNPILVKTIKDNRWDWFMGIEKVGDRFATIGSNGIKYWNKDMKVVDMYNIKNDSHINISFSKDGRYIFNLKGDTIEIFDTTERKVIQTKTIETNDTHMRKAYIDDFTKDLYIVDDESIKKFGYTSESKYANGEFVHISDQGFDVSGNSNHSYVYFTDGLGVVKINKETMKPIDYAYTLSLGEGGGWAMGLKTVEAGGEKVVIFNNSAILVLDDELELIAYKRSTEEACKYQQEAMYLNLDRYAANIGESIEVQGGGFFSNEDLVAEVLGKKFPTKADSRGRFTTRVDIPKVYQIDRTDIKVSGLESGLSYSVAIKITK